MAPLNLRTVLWLIATELDKLRLCYQDMARIERSCARLAVSLARREAATIDALHGWLDRACWDPVLGMHIRFGAAFPLISPPRNPTIDELLDTAEETDALLEHLHQRVSHWRFGVTTVDVDSMLRGLEAMLVERRVYLNQLTSEVDEQRRRALPAARLWASAEHEHAHP